MPSVERRNAALLEIVRAIIYARVSKDEAGGRSCREQIKASESDCEYEGWPVAVVLMDNDRGASRHSKGERLEFQKLPDILRTGDVLVVWEPSRITRDMREFGDFCDLLADRAVMLYYDGRIYDMRDDDDRNRVWQDILDGAKQAGKTRKRVLRAMSANRDDLKPHGKRSAGYRIIRDARTGKPLGREVDPEQARVLRKAAEMALDPDPAVASMRHISRELADEWVEAGGVGQFRGQDVKRILTNPTTFGLRTSEGVVIGQGTWEPVLDPELMPQLVKALDRSDGSSTRGTDPKHLLSCIALCAPCLEQEGKGLITFRRENRRGQVVENYYCHAYKHVSRNAERVDAHVQEVLMRWFEQPDALSMLMAEEEEGQASVDDELALIEQLRGEVRAFVKQSARRRMSADAVATYVEDMEAQIAEAQARINAATSRVDSLVLGSFGSDAREKWQARTLLQKRSIIRKSARVTIERLEGRGRYSAVGVTVKPIRMR